MLKKANKDIKTIHDFFDIYGYNHGLETLLNEIV